MARLLGGGLLCLLHAPEGGLHAVSQPSRKLSRPLRDGLGIDADGFGRLGYRAAKQGDGFSFGHARMLEHLQTERKHSNQKNS